MDEEPATPPESASEPPPKAVAGTDGPAPSRGIPFPYRRPEGAAAGNRLRKRPRPRAAPAAGLWRERCQPRLPLPFQAFFTSALLALALAAVLTWVILRWL